MAAPQELLPIHLDAGAENWRVFGKNDSDDAYVEAKKAVIKRDAMQCRFCKFRPSPETTVKDNGLEIHFKDGDGLNLDHDNLVTSCNLCRMCFNLDYAGEKKAILAYIPGPSQAQVNSLARSVMFIQYFIEDSIRKAIPPEKKNQKVDLRDVSNIPESLRPQIPILNAAESLIANMKAQSSAAERLIGTSRPEELAQAILEYRKLEEMEDDAERVSQEIKEKFAKFLPEGADRYQSQTPVEKISLEDALYGIRVIPTQPGCDVKAWAPPTGAYVTTLPRVWVPLYDGIVKELKEQGVADLPQFIQDYNGAK